MKIDKLHQWYKTWRRVVEWRHLANVDEALAGARNTLHCIASCIHDIDGLEHKGTMLTKPISEKFAEIQMSHIPLCGHTTFVLLTLRLLLTKL